MQKLHEVQGRWIFEIMANSSLPSATCIWGGEMKGTVARNEFEKIHSGLWFSTLTCIKGHCARVL